MNLGTFEVGDTLYFPLATKTTRDPGVDKVDSGHGDPGNTPTYRIYENATSTPLLTGNLAKLDDANTLAFYQASAALSSGNGFEAGKCYTIYMTYQDANSVDHVDVHFFRMNPAVEGALTEQMIGRIVLAFVAGKVNGAGAGPINYRDQADTKNRLTQTVDGKGNRTTTAVDGT